MLYKRSSNPRLYSILHLIGLEIGSKNSDVPTIEQLFSKKQLAQLAYLKFLIQKESVEVRGCLMLMFSGLLNKVNLTYHSSKGRGDSSVFRYYRYRIAPKPAEVDLMKYFELRFKNLSLNLGSPLYVCGSGEV